MVSAAVSQAKKALSVPGVPEDVAMIAIRKVIAPAVGLHTSTFFKICGDQLGPQRA